MKGNARHNLIVAVTFLGGIYFFLEFILPKTVAGVEFGKYSAEIFRGVQVVGTMAIGLGLINILMVHGIAILKVRKGWYNSVALLAGLLIMFLFEGIDFIQSEKSVNSWKRVADLKLFSETIAKENGNDPDRAIARLTTAGTRLELVLEEASSGEGYLAIGEGSVADAKLADSFRHSLAKSRLTLDSLIDAYRNGTEEQREVAHKDFADSISAATEASKALATVNREQSIVKQASSLLFNGFFAPLGAAMFSLLAFYIATAAYRTFRIRSVEAAIMMCAALFVMLGQMPHGPLYIYEGLPAIRRWILLNLSTPAFRAIYFGAIIAGLAMATRMWLSLEKSPLADEEGGV